MYHHLQNVTVNQENKLLYNEEIMLLLAVADRFIISKPESVKGMFSGSCVISARAFSEPRSEILATFDYSEGITQNGFYSSSDYAKASLNSAFSFGKTGLNIPISLRQSACTLTISAENGIFVISSYFSPFELQRQFLLEMSRGVKELAISSNLDKSLIFSCESIPLAPEEAFVLSRLEEDIWGNPKGLASVSTEEMKIWRDWHYAGHQRSKDSLGFFFSEESIVKRTSFLNDIKAKKELVAV